MHRRQWFDLVSGLIYRTLKAFRHFLTANAREKTFWRIFSHNFGCKKKDLRNILASSSSWKTANTRKPVKTQIWQGVIPESWFQFRSLSLLVYIFVNENCFLYRCFTELFFLSWLLISIFFRNFRTAGRMGDFEKVSKVLSKSSLLRIPCILHRSKLIPLNNPNIVEFSSWKVFIISSII